MSLLNIHNVSKSFGDHTALDSVGFNISKQSIFGLLGPNGAGKTTLIRIITQIIFADSGEIIFNGEKLNPSHIRNMGYLPEGRGLYKKMKVGEQLLYLAQLKGMSYKDALAALRQWFIKFEIIDWWNKKVEDLSKGMQQKVQFITTVVNEPQLIILDEPFSGFDPINVNLIRDEILELRKRGSTIIFSTHRMETVEELCDYIVLINKSKKILEGHKKSIKEQYRSNIFIVEHKSELRNNGNPFKIMHQKEIDTDFYQSTIQLEQGINANQILEVLINQVEIHSFTEKVPGMNEIFIKTVASQQHG